MQNQHTIVVYIYIDRTGKGIYWLRWIAFRFINFQRKKNIFKIPDVAWTTEINRGRPRFNEPHFEKTPLLSVLTAVFIVAVIAGYMYRGLHTGNRGISFSGYCRLLITWYQ